MGFWEDFKKGLKGDKEYQAAKAKKKASKKAKTIAKASKKRDEAKKAGKVGKQKRAQNKIYKASGSKVKHTKASVKKANKADESWSKASKSAKASGTSISSLVKKRKGLKKGTAEYAKVQNQINKHYGVKKRHSGEAKSSGVGRLDRDKVGGKVKGTDVTDIVKAKSKKPKKAAKKPTVHKTMSPSEEKTYMKSKKANAKKEAPVAGTDYEENPDLIAGPKKKEMGGMVDRPQYGHGGKVEGGGLFNFPTKDARKR